MRKTLTLLLLVLFVATSALAADKPAVEAFKKSVGAAKKATPQITPAELKKMIDEEADFLLIDVREPNETAIGTIEADELLTTPRGLVDVLVPKSVDTDRVIVTYCKVGGRGALAAARLKELGYENVKNLDGGIQGWLKEGYPIVTDLGLMIAAPAE